MKIRTAARAATSLYALDEWRSMFAARSVYIRISTGLHGDALWHVELWSIVGGEARGVTATSGELGGAVRDAMKKAEEASLA